MNPPPDEPVRAGYDDVGEIWKSEATILDIEGCDAL